MSRSNEKAYVARSNPKGVGDVIDVRVSSIAECGRDIRTYTLESLDQAPLPSATAGSHIDLHLPNGLIRQYSLILTGKDSINYRVAIKRDAASSGGSVHIYNKVRVGTILKISTPRNHFPLEENAPHSVLIAGGIGITPIFSMAQRLLLLNKSWELYYACRSRADLALADEMPRGSHVHLHFDDESGGSYLDLKEIIAHAPANSHFYCCGPLPLMAGFESASAEIPPEQRHFEYFTPKEAPSLDGGFVVRLARSGRVVAVPAGHSILEVLEEAGVAIEHSCTEGICGTCEIGVLAGIPDHRDSVLTPAERAANNTIIVCCSGSKSEELVLDL
jgi:tetrachlorobenzoquinone reductase